MIKCFAKLLPWLLLLTISPTIAGVVVPNAADIPRPESSPAIPLPKPSTIEQAPQPAYQPNSSDQPIQLLVKTFTFSGNQVFSQAQLAELLTRFENRQIGLTELNQATKIVTEFYRKHGYFLAQAYLPAQDIAQNTVEIAVLEGQLGQLSTNSPADLNAAFMQQMAQYQLKAGDAISEQKLVRNITLLNALPAISATAQLNPGEATGTSDVAIEIQALPRWQGYVGVNTYGNRFTGREVAFAGLAVNNLAGLGDQLSLNVKNSSHNGQRGVQLGYITPINAAGTLLNASYNYVDYELGGAFKALKAYGDSEYFNLNLDQTLYRDAQKGLIARVGLAHKKINDEVSSISLKNQRNINNFDAGIYGDWFNAIGDTQYQLGINLRAGRVIFKDDFAKTLDETGADTAGGFVKYNLTASRVQYLNSSTVLSLLADYQLANKNLDSVEKITIGGINRWRPFAELPSLADNGLMLGAEIKKTIVANPSLASLLLEQVRPFAFFDIGRGKINQQALSDDNHVNSQQYGLGVDLAFKKQWLLSVSGSHQRRDNEGASAENETRLWGQLQKAF